MKLHSIRGQFFCKSLLTNLLFLLLPILLIGSTSIYYLYDQQQMNARSSNYNLLYQINQNIDGMGQVMDNLYVYLLSNRAVSGNIRRAYAEPVLSLSSIRDVEAFSSILRNYLYTSSYIDSINVYYYNNNARVLSAEKGGMVPLESIEDNGWLASGLEHSESNWVEKGTSIKDGHAVPVIRQYQKLPNSLNSGKSIGFICISYKLSAIQNYSDSLGLSRGQVILIANSSEQGAAILFQSEPGDYTGLSEGSSLKQIKTYTSQKDRIDNSTCIVSYLPSTRSDGLLFISVTPESSLRTFSSVLIRIILFIAFAAVIFAIFLAWIRTRQDYRRLSIILELLSHPEKAAHLEHQKHPSNDLYGYITYNILHLFLQQDYLTMQTSAQKYRMQALEMTALQQQINPHFLHNTLNTIYWEAIRLTGGQNKCSDMIATLSAIMRYSLGNPEDYVRLQQELDYLKSFVKIQKVRYSNKFSIEYDIDSRAADCSIRKITLQPLIENAIHHGIKPKNGTGRIRLRVHCRPHCIYISVIDDGVGMSNKQLEAVRASLSADDNYSLHIGLLNVHRRLVISYGSEAGLHIMSHQGCGTAVWFRLPLNT